MNQCQSCQANIQYNDPYITMMYHIETASQNDDGNIVVQVISADEILKVCKSCALNNKPQESKDFLKRLVSQKGGQVN